MNSNTPTLPHPALAGLALQETPVPWAREGSGFTLLFDALALTMCW